MAYLRRSGRRIAPMAAVTVLGAVVAGGFPARAGVEADPGKDYRVAPEAGPWMICVASYMGDPAAKLAHDLVLEIRQRYQLPAYSFNRGAEERRKQQEELDRERQAQREYLKKMGYDPDIPLRRRTVHIEDQYAVLVGGYPDIDTARRMLDRVKKLPPPEKVPQDLVATVPEPGGSGADPTRLKVTPSPVNPFSTSFVVRNPTVPAERHDEAPDPDLKKFNAGEPYSLLKCKKPWTLAVKQYQGAAIIQSQSAPTSAWDKIFGKSPGVQLDAAGQNAHLLAETLRKLNYEAYVLHTRYSSVVCVGSFDSPDDPRIKTLQEALMRSLFTAQNPGNLDAQRLTQQVQLMPRPLPMRVPRP